MGETLLLVDAYSQIYRAFYAIRELTGPTGQPVNAIFGFAKMLKKLQADHAPTHLAVVYDLGAPAARLALLPSYKASRPPTPPALDAQLADIRATVAALGLPIVELDGEEADDLIATLACRAAADGCRVLIATNDKDLAQIVDDRVHLVRPDGKTTLEVDPAQVRERYGVAPGQMVDCLSLIGDSVDEIPGVPGIGPKTAADLLGRYGSLENLLAHTAEIARPKLRAALEEHAATARQNQKLIRLRTALELPVQWRDLRPGPPQADQLRALYRQFGFRTLLAELDAPPAEPAGDLFAR